MEWRNESTEYNGKKNSIRQNHQQSIAGKIICRVMGLAQAWFGGPGCVGSY
jgi:hypothetical protein